MSAPSSGPLPPNPAELLSSSRMRQLLEVVASKYDRIILDGPPYQGFAEILVLANMVEGVILITEEGERERLVEAFREMGYKAYPISAAAQSVKKCRLPTLPSRRKI